MTDGTSTQFWLVPGYADIVASIADPNGHRIRVDFANGDRVWVSLAQFGIPAEPFTLDFDSDEGLSVNVTTSTGGTRTLSWSQIRAGTDERFAQELRRRDDEEARRIGARLRALREDRGISQRDVAKQLSMTPAQLSKIESGTYDLRTSTVQGLLRVLGATYADISGPDAPELSTKALRTIVERVGVPRDVFSRLAGATSRRTVLDLLGRAFGWEPEELAAGSPAVHPPLTRIAFKSLARTDPSESPLLNLAIIVSRLALNVADLPDYSPLPSDPLELRRQTSTANKITLAALLETAWRAGIAVLPINARGGFTAATWNVDGTPVVVLKETRTFLAYWMFDLAHELAHIALGHTLSSGLVDVDSPTSRRRPEDAQEQAADQYALSLLMPNYVAMLADVREETRGNYLRFKDAVANVAARNQLSVGLLGMIAAYELTEIGQDKDRWGSASNLARAEGDGRTIAVAAARNHLVGRTASPIDSVLIESLVLS